MPLDNFLLEVYVSEIRRQCQFALAAAGRLQDALRSRQRGPDGSPVFDVWYHAQVFLGAAANVSKLFWPDPRDEELPGRADELKRRFGLGESSILSTRKLRNDFEHFGARLDEWAMNSTNRHFIDSNVMPPGAVQGIDMGQALRNFDPQSAKITFRGNSFSVPEVCAELVTIRSRADLILGALNQERFRPRP